jgi:hypothetical protein
MVAPACHPRPLRTTSSREAYRNPWIRVREDGFDVWPAIDLFACSRLRLA